MKILVVGANGPDGSQLMRFDGHYDARGCDSHATTPTAVTEGTGYGFRELDIAHRDVVGPQHWQASRNLPADLVAMLSPPGFSLIDGSSTPGSGSRFIERRV